MKLTVLSLFPLPSLQLRVCVAVWLEQRPAPLPLVKMPAAVVVAPWKEADSREKPQPYQLESRPVLEKTWCLWVLVSLAIKQSSKYLPRRPREDLND